MKMKLIVITATVGAALALPSASSAASPPTQDSVTLSGGPVTASNRVNEYVIHDFTATSGPSGENATGHVNFESTYISYPIAPTFSFDAGITCLAVNGNQASINFIDTNYSAFGVIRIQVTDGQPDTFGAYVEGGNIPGKRLHDSRWGGE